MLASVWIAPQLWARPAGEGDRRRQIVTALESRDDAAAARLIDEHLTRDPDDGAMAYNAACVQCRLGDLDRADAYLRQAIRSGYLRFSHMRRDPDIDPLRDRPIYRAIMAARDAADELIAGRRVDESLERLEGEHYHVRADADRRIEYVCAHDEAGWIELRDRVGRQADHLFDAVFGVPLRHRVLITLPAGDDLESAFPDRHVHGVYRHEQRLLVTRDSGRALRHELVHMVHHDHMDAIGQQHPMWIQEGVASLYESHRFGDDGVVEFLPNGRDVYVRRLLGERRTRPWRELLDLTDRQFNADPARHYAQARSIMRFVTERAGLVAWYRAYVESYDADPSGAHALETVLGEPLESIEASWRRWVEREELVEGQVEAETSPPPPATPTPAPPAVVEVAVVEPDPVATAYAETRSLHGAAAITALEHVIELDPDHADARYDLALAFVRLDDLPGARRQHEALRHLDPSLASLLANLLR